MTTVGVHEAKTRLSELLRAVEGGEEVLITRGPHPVARIVPISDPTEKPVRRFGMLADQISDPGDWDDDDSDALGDLFGIPR